MLTAAMSAALLAGAERIGAAAIEAADYQPPSCLAVLRGREEKPETEEFGLPSGTDNNHV